MGGGGALTGISRSGQVGGQCRDGASGVLMKRAAGNGDGQRQKERIAAACTD